MYCPLCKAEYREGFGACSTCAARLVAADAPEAERNPPLAYWESNDRKKFDELLVLLRESGVPCFEKAEFDHWLYAIRGKKPQLHLILLQRDVKRARQASGLDFYPYPPPVTLPPGLAGAPMQVCPFCSAEFPAGTSRCPSCKGDLLEWEPSDAADGAALPSDTNAGNGDDPDNPEVVWHGGDPVMFSRAVEVLRENQILHHTRSTGDHLAFGMGMPRPMLEIRVRAADATQARELLAEWQPLLALVPHEPPPVEAEVSDGTAPDAVPTSTEVSEAAAEAAQFAKRKSRLRWGVGLLYFSALLTWWLIRMGPLWVYGFVELFSPAQGQARLLAVIFLFGVGATCNVAALVLLFLSWGRKLDKVGGLSLFFGFQAVMFMVQYVLLIL